jgi:hypothetical protein
MAGPNVNYQFLPWYRTGLAAAVKTSAPGGDRGTLTLGIVAKLGNTTKEYPRNVQLIGPGDILGIDARAIVRVDPRPFTNDFEPNYLACVEFFDEDFPWRYSPDAPASDRLLPWLALIVLEHDEFDFADQGPGVPRKASVKDAKNLPPVDQLWAWAHTHLNELDPNPAEPQKTGAKLASEPARGCSRLMAPRRLKPSRAYRAMLVPVFETGRVAGLLKVPAASRRHAWPASGPVDLPVYYEWSFVTGLEGDFEKLAERLKARPVDPKVGKRPLNMSLPLPAPGVPAILDVPPAGQPARPLLQLEGALKVPGAEPSSWEKTSREAFQKWLAEFINLGEFWTLNAGGTVQGAPTLPPGVKLPVILPPSYGRWHANKATLEPADALTRWLEQLNLDPRNRVAAAFGTQVIQRNQEDLMARAWRQYGALFEANALRSRGQFYCEVLVAVEKKHLATLSEASLVSVTNVAHARVFYDEASRVTVQGTIEKSSLLPAAVQPAMRRALRANGSVAKRFGAATTHLRNIVTDLASNRIAAAPKRVQPAGRMTLASRPPADPAGGPAWWGSDWDVIRPQLEEYLEHTRRLARLLPGVRMVEPVIERELGRGDAQSLFSASSLTQDSVRGVRTAVDFIPPMFEGEERRRLRPEDLEPAPEDREFSFIAYNTRQALLNSMEFLTAEIPAHKPASALNLGSVVLTLHRELSPLLTVADRVGRMVRIPNRVKMPAYDPLEKIMAHPEFDEAAYEYLRQISDDHVVPNLSLIQNNTITLLEVNWRFIESYMAGLNHEMARELLWRRYPTDRRGSYFRQFWDMRGIPGTRDAQGRILEVFRDIHPIHGWKLLGLLTALGENRPLGKSIKSNLVLVIRGDLLRRYPNTEVYAVKAIPNPERPPGQDETIFRRSKRRAGSQTERPQFQARFGRDVFCYGFNLTKEEVQGTSVDAGTDLGWYFVLAERFGEPRFGLDEPEDPEADFSSATPPILLEISWAHLVRNQPAYDALEVIDLNQHNPLMPGGGFVISGSNRARWKEDAADMAAIFLQLPYRLYFHASKMLRQEPGV